MHELSIMQSALETALTEARRTGARKILAMRLRIGVLSGVVPEALQFAFEALATGTEAEGATLAIDDVPARFWCAPCAREFVAEAMFSDCPECHTPSANIRSGREMELVSLEIE